ncbi:septal ring lytic transglycosylase RlpA family protein [Leptolyngbya sp. FACHB-36]|uniref:septal ring lytic transglycosylase RlpA family protein n=1 Tax=Leptolyngbya sp. FACHB-36 TaxID=2692808 RepID=UPI0016802A52|nr:septal ring lytic transglycosylase RlpA family protein [Leptolyngbya sp. FACHB-36]MBD2020257.1 septal ring lytic transglycosylase RlpA family protein [Leptolyngbya sp. FACHB-36]
MNQKLLSSLTATLLVTTLGVAPSGHAKQPETANPGSESNLQTDSKPSSTQATDSARDGVKLGNVAPPDVESVQKFSSQSSDTPQPSSDDAVKIGEQASPTATKPDDAPIAKVQTHELSGRKAATLYVRNIPVLTFVGSGKTAQESVKLGSQTSSTTISVTAVKSLAGAETAAAELLEASETEQPSSDQDDPIWRASAISAKLNQLNRDGIDAKQITVKWEDNQYRIKVSDAVLAKLDANTQLPDTTRNLETDALQATNRLRRLLGDAAPLSGVAGKPRQQISLGPININGWASWYGPGFHGNPSASGERFNQHAMTAAHRTLPFGTRVLVTNLNNGMSVVVRINDRGPFHGNRIIDLSAAAARILGVLQTGVAPVRLDIVNPQAALSN